MRPIDQYFLQQEEPVKSCLLALRELVVRYDDHITEHWKYGMPFYYYKGKMLCYLWFHNQYRQPYIGFMDGYRLDFPQLLLEKRARAKIVVFDPAVDLPIEMIEKILRAAIAFHQ